MDTQKILAVLDHTLLRPDATWNDVETLCDEAVEYGVASICIPSGYVRDARQYLQNRIPICCVTGFPLGNCSTGTKLFEAKTATADGATEMELTLNLGYLKEERYDKVFSEISGMKAMVGDDVILKVAVETGMMSDDEMIRLCMLAAQAGADYIHTSTGYFGHSAPMEDIPIIASHTAGANIKIKASGGIDTPELAQKFLDLGVTRIGSATLIATLRARGISGQDVRRQLETCPGRLP